MVTMLVIRSRTFGASLNDAARTATSLPMQASSQNGVEAPAVAFRAVMSAYPAIPNKKRTKAYWISSLAAKIAASG
jgi:hypothetical protein